MLDRSLVKLEVASLFQLFAQLAGNVSSIGD